MEVGISIAWEIVVDSQVDTLDVNTTTEDVCGNADALVELLELLISLDTIYSLDLYISNRGMRHTVPPDQRQSGLQWKGSYTREEACRVRWLGPCS